MSADLPITLDTLRHYNACGDAREAFAQRFPSGATYRDVQAILRAENRYGWSWWLADAIYRDLLDRPALVTAKSVEAHVDMAREIIEAAPPVTVETATDADDAQIGSSGDAARIGSSGYAAQIGSSGYAARIGSSGYAAQIGSSGDAAQIGSSGYAARIGSSGDAARIVATGENATIVCAGSNARVKAGKDGCIALTWHDGTRNRVAVGYVGENIKAETWYGVSESGELVEVTP